MGVPLSFPRTTQYTRLIPSFQAPTLTFCPGRVRDRAAWNAGNVGVGVLFNEVITLPTSIGWGQERFNAGASEDVKPTMPIPGCTGATPYIIIVLKRTPNRKARSMLTPAPTE